MPLPLPLLTGVIVGHVRACANWHVSESHAPTNSRRNPFTNFSKSAKFAKYSPSKVSRYTVYVFVESHLYIPLNKCILGDL